jgi:hypothetical protein
MIHATYPQVPGLVNHFASSHGPGGAKLGQPDPVRQMQFCSAPETAEVR